MSSSDKSIEAAFVLVFLGGGFLVKGLKDYRKSRKIQDTARIDIASAPQGLVELEGYAWPLEPSIPAVCGRHAVYYHYQVQEEVQSGKNRYWQTRFEFKHNASFYIFDQSGFCIVNPTEDSMDLTKKITHLSSYAESVQDLMGREIANPGLISFGKLFSNSYRLVEYKLLVGAPVYVCGSLQGMNSNKTKIRGNYKKFLTQVQTMDRNPIYKMSLLDKNRDGKLSDEEISLGYSDLVNVKDIYSSEEAEIKIFGSLSTNSQHKLIVADGHEAQYIKRLTSYNLLKIWGGVAMIGVGLFIAVFHFRSY